MSLAKAMAARQRAYGRRGARWFDISIKGERELMKTFDKMSRRFGNAVTLPILLEGAVIVGDEIERRAPQQEGRWLRAGRSGGAIFDERGGNLKGGIVAKMFTNSRPGLPGAFVAIDYRIAPHAHLVERGTAPRYHASGKYVGAMPPMPYFRPGVVASGPKALKHMVQRLEAVAQRLAV